MLVKMCRVVDTLLIEQEMVYTPRQGNDRLLLGLKRQTLLWFTEQDAPLPVRQSDRELQWRRPSYGGVCQVLTHPVHGGAYAYGKTEQDRVHGRGVI